MIRLISPHQADIGFPVKRLLPSIEARSVGAFVFFDHMGPYQFAPNSTEGDVRPHPHIGLSTVTYLISGAMMHRDSLGVVARIEPEALNLMTAGSGVVHSERIPEDIRAAQIPVQGLQTWLALPPNHAEDAPHFEHYRKDQLPLVELPCATARVLIGTAFGVDSPVQVEHPTFYVDIECEAASTLRLDHPMPEQAVYVVSGHITLSHDNTEITVAAGTMALLPAATAITLQATQPSRVMWLGGEPLPARPSMYWNFVAYDRERIEQAKADWSADRFASVAGEHERIPLPTPR